MDTNKNIINIDSIIDKSIFELLGIQNASQEKKDKVMSEMAKTVQNRVLARILDNLDDAGVKEFEIIIDKDDEEETKKYLLTKNIDLVKLATEETLNYKTEIINIFNSQNK